MATFGLIREHSQHLSFGEFSAKFATLAARAPWLSEPTVIESARRHATRCRRPTRGRTPTR